MDNRRMGFVDEDGVRREYGRMRMRFASLLESGDVELAEARGKVLAELDQFRMCAEDNMGIVLEAVR